jgi:hypothetical protein
MEKEIEIIERNKEEFYKEKNKFISSILEIMKQSLVLLNVIA